ncbi:hypothetical protein [Novosphingobium sp.]|uniref:hypothetical protein n=1 Tax=Novosphingobium sp. TaxID=1874826 RepID=UPI003D14DC91
MNFRTRPFSAQTAIGVLLGAIALLAAWLRLRHAAQSMVYDEMASMYFSGQPWSRLWGWWMARETNPPLFYSLLKVWRGLVPMGHWEMRALPLAIAAAHLMIFTRFLRVRLGWAAALLGLLLFAVQWSDIYQSAYLRGYSLAKLAVLVSFIALLHALETTGARQWRGWAGYVLGSVVAIYCHTTMVLWPVIATVAVVADALWRRDWRWRPIAMLIGADLVTVLLSGWVLAMALVQLKSAAAANLTWLAPLNWADYISSCNLQLLTGGMISAIAVAVLVVIGAWRGRAHREVRMAVVIVIATVALFKATDSVHPIVSDYTLHWCFTFVAMIAAAALPGATPDEDPAHRVMRRVTALSVLGAVALAGLIDLLVIDYIGQPQDFRYTVRTVADERGAALLASHESMGVVIEQACVVEYGRLPCPFPLVVMADPKRTDNWADGGYHGHLVAPAQVRAALGRARIVYAFERYYYVPLQHLGLNPRTYFEVMWDDGELVGPMLTHTFDPPAKGAPARVPDPDAQYTGAPTPPDAPDAD